jgi:hypothetical protein
VSGIDKNGRDKRGYANPDDKTRHEHGYVTLCGMRLAIPDDCCNQAVTVRRVSAVKLIDGLAGESPASADCPVGDHLMHCAVGRFAR